MQISRHWRLNSQRYRLQGVRYGNGEVRLQARPVACIEQREVKTVQERVPVAVGSLMMEARKPDIQSERFTFAGTGEIFQLHDLQDPPEGYEDQTPYVLALVKLDEGPLITAQITDLDEPPAIGDRVEMVTRKLTTEGPRGVIVYGYKFRKVLPQN